MATKIGPKTVTQRDRSKNLVFCVDAANSRSYGGEPTTNLLANSSFNSNSTVTVTSNVTVRGQTFTRKCVDGTGYSTPGLWPIDTSSTVLASTQYTFSLRGFMEPNGGGVYLYVQNQSLGNDLLWTGALLPTKASYFSDPSNEIVSSTFTTPSGTTAIRVGVLFSGASGTGGAFYIKECQLEAKAAPTPFIIGSRSATTAITNISGVGAQGTDWIQGSAADTYGQSLFKPTTRNVLATTDPNQGHIGGAYWDLDGTDEAIDCYDMNEETGTLAFWMKSTFSGSSSYPFGKQKGTETLAMSMHSANSPSHSGDFWVRNTAGGSSSVQTNAALNDGVWHQVVAMWGVGGLKIYVD